MVKWIKGYMNDVRLLKEVWNLKYEAWWTMIIDSSKWDTPDTSGRGKRREEWRTNWWGSSVESDNINNATLIFIIIKII